MKIEVTPFQKNNLLVFLDRVTTKGIDEANALLEVFQLIQATESNHNIPPSDVPTHTDYSAPLQDKSQVQNDLPKAPLETPTLTPPPASV